MGSVWRSPLDPTLQPCPLGVTHVGAAPPLAQWNQGTFAGTTQRKLSLLRFLRDSIMRGDKIPPILSLHTGRVTARRSQSAQ